MGRKDGTCPPITGGGGSVSLNLLMPLLLGSTAFLSGGTSMLEKPSLISSSTLSSSSSPAFFMKLSKKLFVALLGLERLRDRELTVVVVGRGFAAEVEEEEDEEDDVWSGGRWCPFTV